MKTDPNDLIKPEHMTQSHLDSNNSIVVEDKTIGGLTKREYFAGLAMQGFISDGKLINNARSAVKCADALMAELNKEQE